MSLGVLAGCQLLSGIDPADLPAQDTTGSAGVSAEGGGGGAAGLEGDTGGGGQTGSGQTGSGQAGGAGGLPRPEPTLLALAGRHSCVRDQGVARCWGLNLYGQLGSITNSGTTTPTPTPTLVDSNVLTDVLQPVLGSEHSCALRADGRILCWGYNEFGQLGITANNDPNPVPTPVAGLGSLEP